MYTVARAERVVELTDEVNKLVKQGYTPCGNLVVDGCWYLQPMFKQP